MTKTKKCPKCKTARALKVAMVATGAVFRECSKCGYRQVEPKDAK